MIKRPRTWSLARVLIVLIAPLWEPSTAFGQATPPSPPAMSSHRGENGENLGETKALAWMLTYNSDLNADIGGGGRTGAAYLQRIGLLADADLDQLFGWRGAKLHASVHAINGRGLSSHDVGNILTVSGIEAEPALRLFNLWIEQSLSDHGSLRVGQFTAAQEFMLSSTAALFINSTFGWPASFASDLPSGGPAYPLAAPGVRLAVSYGDGTVGRIAIFAGDPAGPGAGDPQKRDRHGFNGLRLEGAPFLIGEVSRSFGGEDPRLRLVVGAWMHLDRFEDVSGASSHARNYAFYAIADARLSKTGQGAVRGFIRASASPPNRNPLDLYVDTGLTLTGPLGARADDVLGIAFAVARISPQLRALLRSNVAIARSPGRVPGAEGVIELSYQLKLNSRAYLQPDAQWIVHPAGWVLGEMPVAHPQKSHALVVGLRSSLTL